MGSVENFLLPYKIAVSTGRRLFRANRMDRGINKHSWLDVDSYFHALEHSLAAICVQTEQLLNLYTGHSIWCEIFLKLSAKDIQVAFQAFSDKQMKTKHVTEYADQSYLGILGGECDKRL